ncbi:MAG TPA: hypothetical protein ENI29_08340 [bacterium]|nr:hypothetical protein [bacterium]
MSVKKNKNKDPWTLAKKKYHLTARQIEMAKKLGMNPKKFGRYAQNKSQSWKEPLGCFIEKCYDKRFS